MSPAVPRRTTDHVADIVTHAKVKWAQRYGGHRPPQFKVAIEQDGKALTIQVGGHWPDDTPATSMGIPMDHPSEPGQEQFNHLIGRLDRILSELIGAANSGLDDADKHTLKHHAEDTIGACKKVLKTLGFDVDTQRAEAQFDHPSEPGTAQPGYHAGEELDTDAWTGWEQVRQDAARLEAITVQVGEAMEALLQYTNHPIPSGHAYQLRYLAEDLGAASMQIIQTLNTDSQTVAKVAPLPSMHTDWAATARKVDLSAPGDKARANNMDRQAEERRSLTNEEAVRFHTGLVQLGWTAVEGIRGALQPPK